MQYCQMEVLLVLAACIAWCCADRLTSEEAAAIQEGIKGLLAIIESMAEKVQSHDELLVGAVLVLENIGKDVAAIRENLGAEVIVDPYLIGSAQLRLVDGDNDRHGRLEVFHGGRWGTVCHDDFTDAYAAVICERLGFPSENAEEIHNFGGGDGKPIHLDGVVCDNVQDARYCMHAGWGINNCNHDEDLGIRCR